MALVGLGKAISGNGYSNNGGSVKMGGTTAFTIDTVAVGGVPSILDGDPNSLPASLALSAGSSGMFNYAVGTGWRAANDKSKLIDTDVASNITRLRRGDATVVTSGSTVIFPERDISGQFVGSELPYGTGFQAVLATASGSDRGSPNARTTEALYNFKLGGEVHQKGIAKPTT